MRHFFWVLAMVGSAACSSRGAQAGAASSPQIASIAPQPLDATEEKVAPEPALPWDPGPPQVHEEAGTAWVGGPLQSLCDPKRPIQLLLETEQDFREAFCRKSAVDWTQHRVAVHAPFYRYTDREFVVVHVRVDELVHVFVHPTGPCRGSRALEGELIAVVLPKGPSAVEFREGLGEEQECPLDDVAF